MLLSSDLKHISDLQSLCHYSTVYAPDASSFCHYVSSSSVEFCFRFHGIFSVVVTSLVSDPNLAMLDAILKSKSAPPPPRSLSQKEKLALLRVQARLNLRRKGGKWYSTKYRLHRG